MSKYLSLLQGGDLRSVGKVDKVVSLVKTQKDFGELIIELRNPNRLIAMRAADAVEKLTAPKPEFLSPHKKLVLSLLDSSAEKELKWHLAQIVSRLKLTSSEVQHVWNVVAGWVRNKEESRIVRVFSLEALALFSRSDEKLKRKFNLIVDAIKGEPIPSLQARIRKLARVASIIR